MYEPSGRSWRRWRIVANSSAACSGDGGGPSASVIDVKKQLVALVWQVGPAASAWTRIVSPSQSIRSERSFRTWPDDSPFIQSRPRLRLQNQTLPSASVFSYDSRFM